MRPPLQVPSEKVTGRENAPLQIDLTHYKQRELSQATMLCPTVLLQEETEGGQLKSPSWSQHRRHKHCCGNPDVTVQTQT